MKSDPRSRSRNPNRTPSLRSAQNPVPSVKKNVDFSTITPGLQPRAGPSPRGPSLESRPTTVRPVTRVRSETRERPVNPCLDPRRLHTHHSLIVPRVTSAARLLSAQAASSARRRLGSSGGLFGSRNLFPARLTPFRPSRTWFRPCLR